MFGGMAHLDSAPNTSRASFWIAIAGPIASFIAAAGLFGAHILLDTILLAESIISQTLLTFARLNFVLGAFNLLMPVFPLDGGQVLYSALWKMKGDALAALHLCVRIGRCIIIGIFVFVLVPLVIVGIMHPISFLWYLFIAIFIWQIQPANLRAVKSQGLN
jgi:Zn-dependent protease